MHLLDKKCLLCNKYITTKKPRDKVKTFCNRKCASIYLFKKETRTFCKSCNIKLHARQNKFCSYSCFIQHVRKHPKTKTLVCLTCGITQKYKGPKKRYCSYKCYFSTQRTEVDDFYFQNIDSEEKAYWLGFLLADGYNDGDKKIIIRLASKDREHLNKLKVSLKYLGGICDYIDNKDEKCYKNSVMSITSKQISTDLTNLGCIKAKSLVVQIPTIEKVFMRHLVRGYFDGDGSISIYGKRKSGKVYYRASVYSGSIKFIQQLKEHLRKENILFGHSNEKLVSFCSKKSLVEFYNYLYKDSNIFLDRKKNIYDECVSRFRMNIGCTRR
jgi:hypothetical protein